MEKPNKPGGLEGSPAAGIAASTIETGSIPDELWEAAVNNDASYDGQFFYAVKTTGIFCRPSCKSRPPKKENIRFFRTADEALSAKFRPCKRCKPTGERLPDDEWIAAVTEYIDRSFTEALSLDHLAGISHGSPYHLHRTFKKVKGVTPVEYIHQKRVELAKQLLLATDKPIGEIGMDVGISNTPYFITLFKKKTGRTPASYRQRYSDHRKEATEHGKQD
ncbi:bifunctional transcriptional activator/DNA repair enzyme AdaA [Paenibacillus doosanensis]|uniref:bifunctional transcriptional activator/DNA repair enzyme AdaA n=1 Tax=Paenibacillus doosanensis TaxID=1229154 RepID=UPI00217FBD2D|nr:bifunctional transcriptional activator/DNA repair enzyme AdaA [Paenibacillus doosanensis]MCS7463799.1 bifunctional transcriptional activator/DNA repair enzyme AdaA [Paenibacillus doosanensis]